MAASFCPRGFGSRIGVRPCDRSIPTPPGPDGWDVFECDYYGFTVAEVDGTGARVVVEGLKRAKHPDGGVGHQRRLMEEQLFDVALRTGAMPTR